MRYNDFKEFLEREEALTGFNLTGPLVQKLFSELDPHRKGFLNINDWRNSFKTFSFQDQLMVELKNVVASTFADPDSVFRFFLNFGSDDGEVVTVGKVITYPIFEKAVMALTSERFKKNEINNLWNQLVDPSKPGSIDSYQFRSHFEQMTYRGSSSVKSASTGFAATQSSSASGMGRSATMTTTTGRASSKSRTTIQTATASSAQWEANILERLRVIIQTSPKSLQDIFNDMDEDGNGVITANEFRNAIRKLGLGLTSRQIDQLMAKIDVNQDGRIDYNEF